MVNVLINKVQNTLTITFNGMYGNDEERVLDLENNTWYFDDGRFIISKKLGINEYERVFKFNLPANDVYIQFIPEEDF